MMSGLPLEDFDDRTSGVDGAVSSTLANRKEAEGLTAFEQGYKTGWKDAIECLDSDREKLSVELTENLASLSFTFQEAKRHVVAGTASIVAAAVERIIPYGARRSMVDIILGGLNVLTEKSASGPITLLAPPGCGESIADVLSREHGFSLHVREEDTLCSGQFLLKFGEVAIEVDVDTAIRDINSAIDEFFEAYAKETLDGE